MKVSGAQCTLCNLLLIFSEYVFDLDIIELDLDDDEEDEGLDLKNWFHVKKNYFTEKFTDFHTVLLIIYLVEWFLADEVSTLQDPPWDSTITLSFSNAAALKKLIKK